MGAGKDPTEVQVTAYSGFKANERPLAFTLEGVSVKVRGMLDRWYGPAYDYFKVLGENGRVYLLRWHRDLDRWEVMNAQGEILYH